MEGKKIDRDGSTDYALRQKQWIRNEWYKITTDLPVHLFSRWLFLSDLLFFLQNLASSNNPFL